MKNINLILSAYLIRLVFGTCVYSSVITDTYAGSDCFQITSPSIPYPVLAYGKGKNDVEVGGLFAQMSGPGLSLYGGGFYVGGRMTTSAPKQVEKMINPDAINGSFGMAVLNGEYKNCSALLDTTLVSMNPQISIEHQLLGSDEFSLVGFYGISVPVFMYWSKSAAWKRKAKGILYGIPLGIQAGYFPFENWALAPFAMLTWFLGGGVSTDNTSGIIDQKITESVDNHIAASFGMDIVYRPTNFSIGSFYQMADSGGPTGQIKTLVVQVSWNNTF